jgi:hypothetical protein
LERGLEDHTYHGRCQAHDSRAGSFLLTGPQESPTSLKNLSDSMQIHEIYCECSPVDGVMNNTNEMESLDEKIGQLKAVAEVS